MEVIAVMVLFEIIIAIKVKILEYAIVVTKIQPNNMSNSLNSIVILPNSGIPIQATTPKNKR